MLRNYGRCAATPGFRVILKASAKLFPNLPLYSILTQFTHDPNGNPIADPSSNFNSNNQISTDAITNNSSNNNLNNVNSNESKKQTNSINSNNTNISNNPAINPTSHTLPNPDQLNNLLENIVQHDIYKNINNKNIINNTDNNNMISINGMPLAPDNLNFIQNMSLPLHDYLINASYQTYLSQDQIDPTACLDSYRAVISRGARFCHLDIFPIYEFITNNSFHSEHEHRNFTHKNIGLGRF